MLGQFAGSGGPDQSIGENQLQDMVPSLLMAILLGGQVVVFLTESLRWPEDVSLCGLALSTLAFIVWLCLPRARRAGLWLLVLGCLALAIASFTWFRADSRLCLLVLPAALAASVLGPRAGFATAALATGAIFAPHPLVAVSTGSARILPLFLIWATQALMWLSWRVGREATRWAWDNYASARDLLDEAREQRVRLRETQNDLVQANLELARLSQRLETMRHMAEEARRIKEEFVANVSHELRTPLNMIIGFSEMITQAPQVYGTAIPPALLADIAVIQANSRHLASLVNDVLDLSQLQAGRMALSRRWVSLQEVIEAAVVAVRPLFDSKGLYLKVIVPPGLPLVFCDATRIRQVIVNLLSNAGRFTDTGGATVSGAREAGRIMVTVADTGPGIPPEARERLFQPFEQLDATIRSRYGGSGLGLAISRHFVELHEGRMWLEEGTESGTALSFSLPLDQLPAIREPVFSRWFSPYHRYEPRQRLSRAPKPEITPRLVLLESGDTLQRLLRRYLDDAEVIAVRSLDEAIEELARAPARALIINEPSAQVAQLPDARLASLPLGTPAIFCGVAGETEMAERLGVVRYLVKPVDRLTLLAAVDALPVEIKTILVVDDEPQAVQLFSRILASAGRGYRVIRATEGARALSLLRERIPDLVLLDLVMADLDGYRLLEEKAHDAAIRHIPVIAISGQDPVRGPVASRVLTVARSDGFSFQELLGCIQTISAVLAPAEQTEHQEPAETPLD